MTPETAGLQVSSLTAGYDTRLPIIHDVSLTAAPGEIVAILGPNGAGKSTLVKCIAGLVPVKAGSIRLDGQHLTAVPAHLRPGRGLAFVPQLQNVFATLSVADNLRLAARSVPRDGQPGALEVAFEWFPDLKKHLRRPAGQMSGGQRQMLAVARALISRPRALLLDEPSAGLSPGMVAELFARLANIRAAGVVMLLVEQNVRAALALADRAYLLAAGRNQRDGSADTLATSGELGALYLGGRLPAPAARA